MTYETDGYRVYKLFTRTRSGSTLIASVRHLESDKLFEFSTRSTTKRAARRSVKAWIIRQGILAEQRASGNKTFDQAFEEYLGNKSCRDVTLDMYRLDFKGLYLPPFVKGEGGGRRDHRLVRCHRGRGQPPGPAAAAARGRCERTRRRAGDDLVRRGVRSSGQ